MFNNIDDYDHLCFICLANFLDLKYLLQMRQLTRRFRLNRIKTRLPLLYFHQIPKSYGLRVMIYLIKSAQYKCLHCGQMRCYKI